MLQILSYAELFLEDKLPACIRFFLEKWREPAQKRINIVFENWTSIDGLVLHRESGVCSTVITTFNWSFKNDVCMLTHCYADSCSKEVSGCNL